MAKVLSARDGERIWKRHIVPAEKTKPKPQKMKGFRDDISKYQPFYDRWQAGEPIISLAKESGLKRSKFRRVMQALSGGKDAYKAKREEGAGGKKIAQSRAGSNGTSRVDDRNVPFTASCCKSDGWSVRYVHRPVVVKLKLDGTQGPITEANYRELVGVIYTDPDGQQYVRSADTEKADLIRLSDTEGIPNIRLRFFEGSAVARYLESIEMQQERGAAAIERIQATKRARREARKAKKVKTRRK